MGSAEESVAVSFLENAGYEIIERNFRCRQGEIDIIAADGDILCFIEVKFRSNDYAGNPGEAIDYRKQQTIYKVAEYYLYKKGLSSEMPCRFDAVVIVGDNVELIKDAFGGLSS
ncbi:MAG: YraN family protein [Lachnospiraceae bacterium]|nr:YraN family protein [Lachnospiraceae bacterium]